MNAPHQKIGAVESAPAVVVPIIRGGAGRKTGRKKFENWLKRHWIRASALAFIAVPTLVVAIYLGFIASDRYAVEVKFAVRGQDTPAVDALGVFGIGGGNMSSDSYILVDYVRSRSLWEEVAKSLDLKAKYSSSSVDWFSRLDPEASMEDTIGFWRHMTQVSYEPATGIIRVEVSAFDKADAVKISQAVTAAAETLINRLSTESRRDALKAATTEVERAEQRQRMLRAATQKFREREQIADPVRRAGAQQEMVEKTRAELGRIDTELQAARAFMKEDAPSIVVLKNQRSAIAKQLDTLQKEMGNEGKPAAGDAKGDGNRTIASMLSNFEEIEAERHFAEKAYLTSLAGLERARFEADRKQRYLAIFERASMPDEAVYPARLRGVEVVAIASALIWGLFVLIVFGIREHV